MNRLFIYGDSNTYGYDPADWIEARYPEEIRWVDRIQKELKGVWEISSDGMNGRCIPERAFDRELLLKRIKSRQPLDFVAIMLGTNDFVNMYDPNPEAVAGKLERLLRWLMEELPGQKFMILTPPAADFRTVPGMERYNMADGRLPEAYRKVAERTGAVFINTDLWELPMAYDRGHLAAEGHLQFARCFARYLREHT